MQNIVGIFSRLNQPNGLLYAKWKQTVVNKIDVIHVIYQGTK